MPNHELANRVADRVERSDTFDMFQMFHEDGSPSCIAGHLLDEVGYDRRGEQPTMNDIIEVSRRLGVDINTTMRLCQPMRETTNGAADVRARPGSKQYVTKEKAAANLRRVGNGEQPVWDNDLPVINARVLKN